MWIAVHSGVPLVQMIVDWLVDYFQLLISLQSICHHMMICHSVSWVELSWVIHWVSCQSVIQVVKDVCQWSHKVDCLTCSIIGRPVEWWNWFVSTLLDLFRQSVDSWLATQVDDHLSCPLIQLLVDWPTATWGVHSSDSYLTSCHFSRPL